MRRRLLMVAVGLVGVLLMQLCAASAWPQSEQESAVKKTEQERVQPASKTRAAQRAPVSRDAAASQGEFTETRLDTSLVKNLAADQKAIWTSPARLRFADSVWLVPLGGLTAGLLVTDRQFSKHLSNEPQTLQRYRKASDYGAASLVGAAGGLYLWGKIFHEDHRRETGILAGEALLNSLAVTETFKYAGGRSRPFEDGGSGRFRQGGTSFPSEHATAAWAMAGVIAHEYPGPLSKLLAYGMASAVSFSRVKAKEHFPSDVLIGSAIGWFIGQRVYRAHHDPELGGGSWETFSELLDGEGRNNPANMGSPYVPLDSWVYAAFDRLAALGYLHTGFEGMRPWTRLECARLVDEAGDLLREQESDSPEPNRLYRALEKEFAEDVNLFGGGSNRSLHLESVYTRFTGISGQPLRDGYHFGQSIINDYGRPFAEGANVVTGFSGWAAAGPFTAYVRGEYQHAPSAPPLSDQARQVIANVDRLPVPPPSTPTPSVDQFRLLDAYVAMNLENWQVSFGKQSLWWGPERGGPLLFTNNTDPINMLRINRVVPFKLPSILGRLGSIRLEFFLGQLSGHEFISNRFGITGQFGRPLDPQPFIHGQKISFKPTPNLEFSVSRTTVFGGPGFPFTGHNFLISLFSTTGESKATRTNPGDRRSAVDFTYRLPRLRKWLTFYVDSFTEDEISPIGYPRRSAFVLGLYAPQIPGLPKMDFRGEGGYTDLPDDLLFPGFFYFNVTWLNSYTNRGNLIGNWIGRQGQGAQIWSTYWLSPRNTVQVNYRHQKVSQQFIPGGGTLADIGVHADFWIRPNLSVSSFVQYEKWTFPVLSSGANSNVTTSVQLTFWPGLKAARLFGTEGEHRGREKHVGE